MTAAYPVGYYAAVDRARLSALGAVGAAIGSALCCAGPLIAVTLGLSGAGIAALFEPLRPYFLAAAGLLLAWGFFAAYRPEREACAPGASCASPVARRQLKRWLWTASGVVVLLATFPWWSRFVLS